MVRFFGVRLLEVVQGQSHSTLEKGNEGGVQNCLEFFGNFCPKPTNNNSIENTNNYLAQPIPRHLTYVQVVGQVSGFFKQSLSISFCLFNFSQSSVFMILQRVGELFCPDNKTSSPQKRLYAPRPPPQFRPLQIWSTASLPHTSQRWGISFCEIRHGTHSLTGCLAEPT